MTNRVAKQPRNSCSPNASGDGPTLWVTGPTLPPPGIYGLRGNHNAGNRLAMWILGALRIFYLSRKSQNCMAFEIASMRKTRVQHLQHCELSRGLAMLRRLSELSAPQRSCVGADPGDPGEHWTLTLLERNHLPVMGGPTSEIVLNPQTKEWSSVANRADATGNRPIISYLISTRCNQSRPNGAGETS